MLLTILFLLGVVYLLYAALKSEKPLETENNNQFSAEYERDAIWLAYLEQKRSVVTSKAQRELLTEMIDEVTQDGPPSEQAYSLASVELTQTEQLAEPAAPRQDVIDNTSLLLYFGAFLFITSIGLFLAFGGLSGGLKTGIVLITALSFYGLGLWLHRTQSRLGQAAITFAGIGIAAMPFVGLAMYNFIFDSTNGATAWFITSLCCLGLYLHAVSVFRHTLLHYVLLVTILSLVESSLSILDSPIYYLGWAMAAVGIAVTVLVRKFSGSSGDFYQSATMYSGVIVPIATAASVILVFSEGTAQLAVSLLIAGLFYGIESRYAEPAQRSSLTHISYVLTVMGAALVAYSVTNKLLTVSAFILILNLVISLILLLGNSRPAFIQPMTTTNQLFAGLGIAFAVSSPTLLLLSLVSLAVYSFTTAYKQHNVLSYGLGMLVWIFLPLVFGQYYLKPVLTEVAQLVVLGASLGMHWVFLRYLITKDSYASWLEDAQTMYVANSLVFLGYALFLSDMYTIAAALVVTGLSAYIVRSRPSYGPGMWVGCYMVVPVLAQESPNGLLAAVTLGLAVNIGLSLWLRSEVSRWLSAIYWIILPITLAGVLRTWSTGAYIVSYLIIMMILLFSRSLARGVLWTNSKVSLASLTRSASVSYVFGYSLAGLLALYWAWSVDDQRLPLIAVLLIVSFATIIAAHFIEKQPAIYALIPVLLQGVVWAALSPIVGTLALSSYLLCVIITACLLFGCARYLLSPAVGQPILISSTATLLIGVGSIFTFGLAASIMQPISLLIFSLLCYVQLPRVQHSAREICGGIGLLAIWWLMYVLGVENVQAYAHILAALFGLYAYLRFRSGDGVTSDTYLYAMLAVATVPLVLQALSGAAGGLYGWWLLIEQIGFMLLGMLIQRPFVTKWGAYVAAGSVLYQLRGLGWAALGLIAMVLIGLAIYRLQKQSGK